MPLTDILRGIDTYDHHPTAATITPSIQIGPGACGSDAAAAAKPSMAIVIKAGASHSNTRCGLVVVAVSMSQSSNTPHQPRPEAVGCMPELDRCPSVCNIQSCRPSKKKPISFNTSDWVMSSLVSVLGYGNGISPRSRRVEVK